MKHFLIAYLDNYHAKMSIKCINIVQNDSLDKEMCMSNELTNKLISFYVYQQLYQKLLLQVQLGHKC